MPIGDFLANPNILQFMAQAGAGLDPEGVGGALGNATSQMITAAQLQKALQGMFGGGVPAPTQTKTIAATPAVDARTAPSQLDIKRAGISPKTGLSKQTMQQVGDYYGLTPPKSEGITGIKMKPDGSITMDYTPKAQGLMEGTANASPFFRTLGSALFSR